MAGKRRHEVCTHIGDYLRAPISRCSLPAQATYLWCKMIAHDSVRFGHLIVDGRAMTEADVAHFMRMGHDASNIAANLSELVDKDVLQRSGDGVLFIPEMLEQEEQRKKRQAAGKKGGNPVLLNQELNQHLKLDRANGNGFKHSSGNGGAGEREDAEATSDAARFAKNWLTRNHASHLKQSRDLARIVQRFGKERAVFAVEKAFRLGKTLNPFNWAEQHLADPQNAPPRSSIAVREDI